MEESVDKTASDLNSSRRSMDMLRLRHICAQTRGGGEGDCPGGPSQTPRARNDGPETQM